MDYYNITSLKYLKALELNGKIDIPFCTEYFHRIVNMYMDLKLLDHKKLSLFFKKLTNSIILIHFLDLFQRAKRRLALNMYIIYNALSQNLKIKISMEFDKNIQFDF